jgi:hypothetical protein
MCVHWSSVCALRYTADACIRIECGQGVTRINPYGTCFIAQNSFVVLSQHARCPNPQSTTRLNRNCRHYARVRGAIARGSSMSAPQALASTITIIRHEKPTEASRNGVKHGLAAFAPPESLTQRTVIWPPSLFWVVNSHFR